MKSLQMGIYDDLDTQTQPLLNIDIFLNNIIVFGDHMSGKTTFLKTLLVRMHQNVEKTDAEEIYIIDFGGNLGEYKKLPLVAACFDNSNEENIRRAFKTVENRFEQNIKQLKSEQFNDAYRDATGTKPQHITLIIDNINSFLADERYAPYQDDLIKFCRDGLSKGLSVVFTANDTSNGLGKFLSNFAQKLVFDVSTEVYIEVFGIKVNEPMKNPGRGVAVINGKPKEFQVFLPFENEKNEISEFISSCSDITCKVSKLQSFADELNFTNFSEYSKDGVTVDEAQAGEDKIVVGLDYYEHRPILVNLKEMRSIAIYGKKKFGKTNLLQLLIREIRRKHPDYTIVLVDDGRKQLETFHIKDNPNSVYKSKLEDLADYLESNGYAKVRASKAGAPAFEEKVTPPTVFVLQSKMLFQPASKGFITAFASLTAKAEERKCYFIYSDMKKIVNDDADTRANINNSISAAFLLDNIAEFVSNQGSKSVFGDMDAKELKFEYARCELGDGYFYDIESDELNKVKFLKV
ncbi:MAG: hypothetical protein E7510_09775 [Ruminococcus sp.]|nr:hypothetical protein [Ruminococcus sp.]